MRDKKIYIPAVILAAAVAISAGIVLAVGSEITGTINVGGNATGTAAGIRGNAPARLSGVRDQALIRLQTRGDNEIQRRVNSLAKLIGRIKSMKLVSASGKEAILAQLQAQIDALTALKAQIAASPNASTTLEYDRSITRDFRVYALTIPQGYIKTSVDRINSLVQKMEGLAAKLLAKINEVKAAGKDVASLQTSLADMNAKISDAKAKAQEAQTLVINLKPDGGDAAIAQANAQALKNARDKIKIATQDLNAARKDAADIAKGLRQLGVKTSLGYANATSTPATSTANH